MKYTEKQLKDALVRALPDRLTNKTGFGSVMWHPKEMGSLVTDHEWPAIVGMVEDGLTDEQWKNQWLDAIAECGGFDMKMPWDYTGVIGVQRLKWQTRAQALAEIDAITVEESK